MPRAKAHPDASAELAALTGILNPWLWIESQSAGYFGPATMALGPYRFEGIVKAEGLDAGTARECRAMLLARAEDAIDALEGKGWQLTACPVFEFGGDITPFSQTLGGKLMEPSRQSGITLHARLEVNRPR